MMNYHGFWLGYVVLFLILPFAAGTAVGIAWAWRKGRRGNKLIAPGMLGGAGLSFLVFHVAALFFRA